MIDTIEKPAGGSMYGGTVEAIEVLPSLAMRQLAEKLLEQDPDADPTEAVRQRVSLVVKTSRTMKEAAAKLGVSRQTLYTWIDALNLVVVR